MSGTVKHGMDEEGRAQMRAQVYERIDDLFRTLTMAALDDDQFDRIHACIREIERELGRRP